jgi:hypothetical protein
MLKEYLGKKLCSETVEHKLLRLEGRLRADREYEERSVEERRHESQADRDSARNDQRLAEAEAQRLLDSPPTQKHTPSHAEEDLPPYPGPGSGVDARHARQGSTMNYRQPPLTQSDSSQASWFQPNTPYRPRPTPMQQPNAHRASAFRVGWDPRPTPDPNRPTTFDPTPGLSRPPTYNSSEKVYPAQDPRWK